MGEADFYGRALLRSDRSQIIADHIILRELMSNLTDAFDDLRIRLG